MPLYEYECLECGERFEIIQKFADSPVRLHAEHRASRCDGAVRKLLAAPAIRFKGSGWYVTDYGRAGKKPPAESSGSGGKKEGKPDTQSKAVKPPAKGSDSATGAAAS